MSAVVSREADRWYISLNIRIEHRVPERSQGQLPAATWALQRSLRLLTADALTKRLRRGRCVSFALSFDALDKALARKRQRSTNYVKAKTKLTRLHAHIRNIRHDQLHKSKRGHLNGRVVWEVRRWICVHCCAEHDRDENAARNLYLAASSAVKAWSGRLWSNR